MEKQAQTGRAHGFTGDAPPGAIVPVLDTSPGAHILRRYRGEQDFGAIIAAAGDMGEPLRRIAGCSGAARQRRRCPDAMNFLPGAPRRMPGVMVRTANPSPARLPDCGGQADILIDIECYAHVIRVRVQLLAFNVYERRADAGPWSSVQQAKLAQSLGRGIEPRRPACRFAFAGYGLGRAVR
jgi:hypothetical protein